MSNSDEQLAELPEQLKRDLGHAIAHGTYLDEEAREAEFNKICKAFHQELTRQRVEARIEELERTRKNYSEQHKSKQEIIAVHDNISKGSTLAMVPLVHINDRIEELKASLTTGGKTDE